MQGTRRLKSSGEQWKQGNKEKQGIKGNRRTGENRETRGRGGTGETGGTRGTGVTREARGRGAMRGTSGNREEGGRHYMAKAEPSNRKSGKMFPFNLKTFLILAYFCSKLPKMLFIS